jgi:hypothetical protein
MMLRAGSQLLIESVGNFNATSGQKRLQILDGLPWPRIFHRTDGELLIDGFDGANPVRGFEVKGLALLDAGSGVLLVHVLAMARSWHSAQVDARNCCSRP